MEGEGGIRGDEPSPRGGRASMYGVCVRGERGEERVAKRERGILCDTTRSRTAQILENQVLKKNDAMFWKEKMNLDDCTLWEPMPRKFFRPRCLYFLSDPNFIVSGLGSRDWTNQTEAEVFLYLASRPVVDDCILQPAKGKTILVLMWCFLLASGALTAGAFRGRLVPCHSPLKQTCGGVMLFASWWSLDGGNFSVLFYAFGRGGQNHRLTCGGVAPGTWLLVTRKQTTSYSPPWKGRVE